MFYLDKQNMHAKLIARYKSNEYFNDKQLNRQMKSGNTFS